MSRGGCVCSAKTLVPEPTRKIAKSGKFFQGRYWAVRILDEETLLACSAYVDLNLIRASMAETIELSDFTSAQRRIESIQTLSKDPSIESASLRDSFLAPLTVRREL